MIQNIYNPQGFFWWVGVCESRADPEKAGRCQVRIFGDHSSNKEQLPTKDLPWAIPMQPITSAATSGKGSSPIGPVEGTWVIGWYLDGADKQMPMMIGCVAASTISTTYQSPQERPPVTDPATSTTKEKADKQEPSTTDTPEQVPARKPVAGWELGKTSEKYESGGKGPGVINDYNKKSAGDYGGASYGTYQLASYLPPLMPSGKARPSATNSPLVKYIRGSRFKLKLQGLKPATPEFDEVWKSLAKEYPNEFKDDQHEYIKKNYYDVMLSNIKRHGIDLSGYGPAVQDMIWSTSVQLGPGAVDAFVTPLKGKSNLTEAEIVTLVMDYKTGRVPTSFASSSAGIKQSVVARYTQEKRDLLKMIT